MRGSTSDSIRTTLMGGKIPLGLRSETPVWECPIAYLALIAVCTMLPYICNFRNCYICLPFTPYILYVYTPYLRSSCLQHDFHPKGIAGEFKLK